MSQLTLQFDGSVEDLRKLLLKFKGAYIKADLNLEAINGAMSKKEKWVFEELTKLNVTSAKTHNNVANFINYLTKNYSAKIPCIKEARNYFNIGLKESKDLVENYIDMFINKTKIIS